MVIAGPDDAHDVAGIGSNEGFFVRHPQVPRHALVGDSDKDRGFFDGEEPFSALRIRVHEIRGEGYIVVLENCMRR